RSRGRRTHQHIPPRGPGVKERGGWREQPETAPALLAAADAAIAAAVPQTIDRNEMSDRPVVLGQILLRDTLNVGGADRAKLVQQRLLALIAVQHLPHPQLQRLVR